LRLFKAYTVAAFGYAAGLFVSAWLDLPSGAVVVWALAIAGIVCFALEGGLTTRPESASLRETKARAPGGR
jgi:zinc/manganese transport system permease protein